MYTYSVKQQDKDTFKGINLMDKIYLSPEALSLRWGLPLTTLSQWRWHGKGPEFSKMGRRVRYDLKDVEDFEKQIVKKNTCYDKYDLGPNIKKKKEIH